MVAERASVLEPVSAVLAEAETELLAQVCLASSFFSRAICLCFRLTVGILLRALVHVGVTGQTVGSRAGAFAGRTGRRDGGPRLSSWRPLSNTAQSPSGESEPASYISK